MARYHATLETTRSVDELFDYMSHFDNTREWDPGVVQASREDSGELRVGSRFKLLYRMAGVKTTFIYEITALDPERHTVTLHGTSSTVDAIDTLTVDATGTGSILTYDAIVTLKGPLKIFNAVLDRGFKATGDKALAGLNSVMNG